MKQINFKQKYGCCVGLTMDREVSDATMFTKNRVRCAM
jgi:hypothetical protein